MTTKVELQAEFERCEIIIRTAISAEAERDFSTAVKRAESALPHLHPAVTYQRRFLKLTAPAVTPVDYILRYAPPLFLGRSLDAVTDWYLRGTKTDRAALQNIPDRVASAKGVLDQAVRMWAELAVNSGAILRPPSALTDPVIPVWTAMGLIARAPGEGSPGYVRVSDGDRVAAAKCSGCGRQHEAPLSTLLEPIRCPQCGRRRQFVITRRVI